MIAAAFRSVCSSPGLSACWIAAVSHASLAAGMVASSNRPLSVALISDLRPSSGSWAEVTRSWTRSAATVSAIDCRRTCSAWASSLTVAGPSLMIRPRVVSCDQVHVISVGADSERSRARSRVIAFISSVAVWGSCRAPLAMDSG